MGSDSNKKAVKAGAGYVIGNYMLKGITFLSAPIFSRLLSTEDFGIVSVYMSYEAIFSIIVGMALHSSVNNAKYRYKDKLDEYMSTMVLMQIISTGIWMILANLFFGFYEERFGFNRSIVILLVIHCLASALFQLYNIYIGLSYQYKSFLKVSSINAISNIALSVILILFFTSNRRAIGRIWGTAIPIICLALFFIRHFFKKASPKLKKEYVKFSLSFSLPVIPHGISQVILSSFDRIMIKDLVGEAQAGIYSFAYTVNQIQFVLTSALQNVWKPWMFEKMSEKAYPEIRKKSVSYVLGIAVVSVILLLVSPELIKVLGRKEYWDSIECVVPIMVGGFFSFLYTIPSLIEYYYEKTQFIAVGSFGAAGINVLLNYFFIPRFGYVAAAYTTFATYFLYFVFHYIIARMVHKKSIFDTRKIGGISFGVILAGAFVILMRDQWIIRWGCASALGICGLIWAEKMFSISSIVKAKLKK